MGEASELEDDRAKSPRLALAEASEDEDDYDSTGKLQAEGLAQASPGLSESASAALGALIQIALSPAGAETASEQT